MKALGRGFSAAPFNTFTIRFRPAIPKGESHFLKDADNTVFDMFANISACRIRISHVNAELSGQWDTVIRMFYCIECFIHCILC